MGVSWGAGGLPVNTIPTHNLTRWPFGQLGAHRSWLLEPETLVNSGDALLTKFRLRLLGGVRRLFVWDSLTLDKLALLVPN